MSFELNLMNLGVINKKKRHYFDIKWSLSKNARFQPYFKFQIISGVLDVELSRSLYG